jgi:tetratricopeptide (TPR) repeat protein
MLNEYHIKYCKTQGALLMFFMMWFTISLSAQADRKFIRQGNREYEKEKYSESEISYRRAIDKNKASADAVFNAGDALYRQKKYEDAGKQFIESHTMNEEKDKRSASMYNLGNSFLMAEKLKESIDAYKNSLKLNPGNMEAKYNLAYAQDMLRKHEEQQQQQQQNKDNQDQNKDQDKKEDKNKDQQQQQKDQQNQDENKQQDQKQQQQEQAMSKEDAERLLNAIANDEKNVQEKVKLAKAAKERVKTLKNW